MRPRSDLGGNGLGLWLIRRGSARDGMNPQCIIRLGCRSGNPRHTRLPRRWVSRRVAATERAPCFCVNNAVLILATSGLLLYLVYHLADLFLVTKNEERQPSV
jgi:hypothetical protein